MGRLIRAMNVDNVSTSLSGSLRVRLLRCLENTEENKCLRYALIILGGGSDKGWTVTETPRYRRNRPSLPFFQLSYLLTSFLARIRSIR